jgi:CO dehydrogenase/acetyl-CoA synthase delta subunit
MAARKRPAASNHLQEAMALLIRNQAAFVEQIARNDQERLALQRQGDERQLKSNEWQRKTEEWQPKQKSGSAGATYDLTGSRSVSLVGRVTFFSYPKTLL